MALAEALLELQELTERLRRDCPWDREQTARTIVPHTVEEAYEVADAALADDDGKLLDELGDLLFQVYFLALLLEEKGSGDLERAREGVFHHVPEALPALLYARKVQLRAAAIGFEYPDLAGALADLEDELEELKAELDGSAQRQAEEVGDLLFACVNVARRLSVDPELELRRATQRFVARVEKAERLAEAEGARFVELPLQEQDRYFDRAKERE